MDMLFPRRALAIIKLYIWNVFDRYLFLFKAYFYFNEMLAAIGLSSTTIILGGHLQWSSIFKGTEFLLNKHFQSFLFLKVFS